MRRIATAILIVFGLALEASAQNPPARTGASSSKAPSQSSASPPAAEVDGIAARIGNDVLTESEVRELEGYQKLLEGHAQDRAKVVDELIDQWIVRTDALATKFPRPTDVEVSHEFEALLGEFRSREEFQTRLTQIGLTQDEVREVLEQQLYYIRFLNYKFHAVTEVSAAQIAAYYQQEFLPELRKRGLSVPPLNKVEAQIRQLLTQEEINEKADQWLEQAKARLRIVIQPPGGGG